MSDQRHCILYLDHTPFIGGAQLSLLETIRTLDHQAFKPIVACSAQAGMLAEEFKQAGAEVIEVPIGQMKARWAAPWRLIAAVRAVHRLILERRIALVHANTVRAQIVGTLAAMLARRPVVWSVRDTTFPLGLYRFLAPRASAVVLISKYIQEVYSSPDIKDRLVYNGINTVKALPTGRPLRDLLGISPDVPLLGCQGRIVRWKGYHVVIEALPAIFQAIPTAQAVVVGEPDLREQEYVEHLKNRTLELGIQDRVHFVGHRSDNMAALNSMDLLVHVPIEPEPFGLVVAEAMWLGKPVVAANMGGPAEIVDPGVTGLLIRPEAREVEQAVISILGDPTRAAAFGLAGRERVEEVFTQSQETRMLEKLYREVLVK